MGALARSESHTTVSAGGGAMGWFSNEVATTVAALSGAFAGGFTAGFATAKLFAAPKPSSPEPPKPKIEAPDELKDPTNAAIWERRPPFHPVFARPAAEDGKPIICVANMKGGVAKTTLTANLAAYFAAKNYRVLLVDFDYQGSLTTTCFGAAGI